MSVSMSDSGVDRGAPLSWISWRAALVPAFGACGFAFQNAALNVSLPFAARDFGVGIVDVSLITLVYLLTIAATLVTAGRLGDLFGSRRVFVVGIALYLGGSFFCGLAPNLPTLLLVRVVQGVGATLGISNEIALAARAASPGRRGQAVGITWMLANIGQLAGLLIGGAIADSLGWRFVFWANLPIALGILAFGWRFATPDPRRAGADSRLPWRHAVDVGGALFFGGGMVALLTALNRGPAWGFGAPPTLALFAAAALFGGLLYWQEGRAASPMLDLRLFQNRVFTAAVGGALTNYLAFMGLTFLAPFYLIEQQGLSATQAGAIMLPMGLTTVAVAYGAGWLADRMGPRPLEVAGQLALAGALATLLALGAPSAWQVGVCLVMAGLGTSLISVPNMQAVIGAVPATQIGLVGGMVHAVRYVGTLGGVALAGAISTLTGDPSNAAAAGFAATYLVLASFAVLGAGLTWTRGHAGASIDSSTK